MTTIKLLLLLLLVPMVSFGQTKEELQLCLAMQSSNFMSDSEAENALDKILNTIGASANFVLTPCSEINNAAATSYKGIRYILYDKEFMQLINSRTNDWASLAILAHEVGHHINGHSLDILLMAADVVETKSLENKRKQELEADEFAGFVLARLGADLNSALAFTEVFKEKDDTYDTHPSKSKRVNAVKKGFNKAGGNSSVANTNNTPTEYTRKNGEISAEDYYYKAITLKNKEDFEGAIEYLSKSIKLKPRIETYMQRAFLQVYGVPNLINSTNDFEKVISLDSKNAKAYWFAAGNHFWLENYYKSAEYYKKAIEYNFPLDTSLLFQGKSYFNIYQETDNYFYLDKAIQSYSFFLDRLYSGALQDDKNGEAEKEAIYYLALSYGMRGENNASLIIDDDKKRAKDLFNKGVKLYPNEPLFYYFRATGFELEGNYYLALNDQKKILELDPNNTTALSNSGRMKKQLGDLNGACADWRKAASLGDKDAAQWVRDQCN